MTLGINKTGKGINLLFSLNIAFLHNVSLKFILCSVIKLIEFHVKQQMFRQQGFGVFFSLQTIAHRCYLPYLSDSVELADLYVKLVMSKLKSRI